MIDQSALFLKGERFGRLVIVRKSRSKREQGPRYRVHCDCGRRLWAKGSKLRKWIATNCGRCGQT